MCPGYITFDLAAARMAATLEMTSGISSVTRGREADTLANDPKMPSVARGREAGTP